MFHSSQYIHTTKRSGYKSLSRSLVLVSDDSCSNDRMIPLLTVLGPPRNVKLDILNRHDVRISWDPPLHLAGEASEDHDYAISWRLDDEEQDNIFVSHNHSYTFRNLQAGQSLVAAVRLLPAEGKHIGQLSETKRISLPAGSMLPSLFVCIHVNFLLLLCHYIIILMLLLRKV